MEYLLFQRECAHLVRFCFSKEVMTTSQLQDAKTNMILYDHPIWKGIIQLSLPVFFVNILKTLHDVVDGVFIGQMPDQGDVAISTLMQSAISLTWPVYFIFLSFGMGLSVAGNALIGQYVGRNDMVNAKKYSFNVLILSFLLGSLLQSSSMPSPL